MYDLYAVVVHNRSTANSGNYFSYVRFDEKAWHLVDDSKFQVMADREKKLLILFFSLAIVSIFKDIPVRLLLLGYDSQQPILRQSLWQIYISLSLQIYRVD
ncbi:uncharacterized protein LOC131621501 [Vicia villosa]|uniref:uncharacterized protein LOC131621501 n=1 Tax=Vicia villosa TaxID=3911 RepID=UPI00273BC245|nr:uncharacterized protein LOC131621501 [Vicia villosa]